MTEKLEKIVKVYSKSLCSIVGKCPDGTYLRVGLMPIKTKKGYQCQATLDQNIVDLDDDKGFLEKFAELTSIFTMGMVAMISTEESVMDKEIKIDITKEDGKVVSRIDYPPPDEDPEEILAAILQKVQPFLLGKLEDPEFVVQCLSSLEQTDDITWAINHLNNKV